MLLLLQMRVFKRTQSLAVWDETLHKRQFSWSVEVVAAVFREQISTSVVHGVPLVKGVVIRFICVCALFLASVRRSKGWRAAPFEEVVEAEKCQCVDSFLACELRSYVEVL